MRSIEVVVKVNTPDQQMAGTCSLIGCGSAAPWVVVATDGPRETACTRHVPEVRMRIAAIMRPPTCLDCKRQPDQGSPLCHWHTKQRAKSVATYAANCRTAAPSTYRTSRRSTACLAPHS